MIRTGRTRLRTGFWLVCMIVLAVAVALPAMTSPAATAESSEDHSSGGAAPAETHVAEPEHGAGSKSSDHGGGHVDPVAPVLIALVLILAGAKIGGDLFERMGQPAVLGELVIGLLIGNVGFWVGNEFFTVLREGPIITDLVGRVLEGASWDDAARHVLPESAFANPESPGWTIVAILARHPLLVNTIQALDVASRIGVVLLLFLVGPESTLEDMIKVGGTALLVATVGVVAPFFLGYGVSTLLLPGASNNVHLFIGATLCATSVGITARVLKDLGKLQTREAKIILGAAVIDDVMGLIILAVVSGIIASGEMAIGGIAWITGKAVIFLAVAIMGGIWLTPHLTRMVARMRVEGAKLVYALCICFVLSWLANAIGLATIVGAFAAGLILTEVQFKDFRRDSRGLEDLLEPLAQFLVPIFFVMMGIQVKLETFLDTQVLFTALGLTIAAIIGKQVCGLACGKSTDRLSVGVGMLPRGEVGLIFASIGRSLGVVSDSLFSAVIVMVMVTTLITPPVLKVTLARWEKKGGGKPTAPDLRAAS